MVARIPTDMGTRQMAIAVFEHLERAGDTGMTMDELADALNVRYTKLSTLSGEWQRANVIAKSYTEPKRTTRIGGRAQVFVLVPGTTRGEMIRAVLSR